jgi:Cd2+/Zn2+-exporting ATPase
MNENEKLLPKIVNGCNNCSEKEQENDDESNELIRIVIAAALFVVGIIASKFNISKYALTVIFAASVLISGKDVFLTAIKKIVKKEMFDENLLMTIAAVGAFSIGLFEESAAVLLFYQIGEYFQDLATEKSKKSIADLMNLRPDYANLSTKDGLVKTAPDKVKVNDFIVIKPGEKIPLDGAVIEGSSFADTSGLTGEPVPIKVESGDKVKAGYVNGDGLLTVKVEKEFGESTVAKIIDLVNNAGNKKAKAENFITKFARIYTPCVTGAALLIAAIPPIVTGQPFISWLYRAIVFLVVACPCALVVSVPLGFFAGIGTASRCGVLVKGGNYLEKLCKVDTMVFDKTGTLTKGVFKVAGTKCSEGVEPSRLINTAALAQTMSSHPIAKSILEAADTVPDKKNIKNFRNIAGMGVIAETNEGVITAGNEKLMKRQNINFKKCDEIGTVVYVAQDDKFLGCIIISDIVKDSAKDAVTQIKKLGVKKTIMLTGDRKSAAEDAAAKVGIDEVRAELLPDQKVSEFEKAANDSINAAAFVGDGINDAPVLARADIGIAMGGIGSDAAVEAADIVIMDDNPLRIASAVKIARYVHLIVMENIIFALTVKFSVLILGGLGIANIWSAVFADTGVTLLAVLNSMRVILNRKKFEI